MQKRLEEILREISEKEQVPFEVLKAIWESQNVGTRDFIAMGEHGEVDTFKNIRWRNFGTFIAKPYVIKKVNDCRINFESKKNLQGDK